MKVLRLFLFVFLIAGLNSCYNYKKIGMLQDDNLRLPVYDSIAFEEYKIQVSDELVFRLITSDQTISTLIQSNQGVANSTNMISYRVFPDGTVDMPFLKAVPVLGLTLMEASKIIEDYYKELIPDAEIKLTLANKSFTVLGDASSGTYPIYKERMSILQALAMSGELNYTANFKQVKIVRQTNGESKILEFDIRPISLINSEYYYIYPNDIIYVEKAPSSFYRVNHFGTFTGLVSSSITLFVTVMYFLTN